eukprot:scaffold1822_cov43-Cyclotella_meneghiniana.AAC.4
MYKGAQQQWKGVQHTKIVTSLIARPRPDIAFDASFMSLASAIKVLACSISCSITARDFFFLFRSNDANSLILSCWAEIFISELH